MSKPSGLWLRKRDNFWMTTINGQQYKLSKDKSKARKMLHKLLADDKPLPGRSGMTLRRLCDSFLVRTKERKEECSHKAQVRNLKAFCESFGHRDPATLKVHEVEEWLEQRDTWANSSKALFITIIKAVFNWADEQQYIGQNPIKKLKRRSTGRRRRVLTSGERERIKAEVSEDLRDFLTTLELTGCRPFSEAAKLTAQDIDWEKGRAMLIKHKTAKKTGRPRLIYFPPPLLARLKERAERYPEGPLFRNRLGNPWTSDTAGKYLRRACEKLGIEGVTSYTIRHSFISTALVKGVPVETVAVLAGNTPKTIWSSYDQVDRMHEALQAAAIKAVV